MKLLAAAIMCLSLAQVEIHGVPDLSTHREVQAQIEIQAPADLVWTILVEFPTYEIWNPYIYPIKGELHPGRTLDVTLHGGDRPFRYEPVVLTVLQKREVSWGGQTLGGVLERVQIFTLTELTPARVRLTSRERFRGLLLPLYGQVPEDARRGLEMMNRALRNRAELLIYTPKR
jgi:hypothetical protein